jgi:hypothetical protein
MIVAVRRRFLIAATIAASSGALALCAAQSASARSRTCGTKSLYGHTLRIRVVGRLLRCSQVRRIVIGRCRERRVWSCFSFRAPAPLLVWFREKERFSERWSTTIEANRYPCRDAQVSRAAWAAAQRSSRTQFPTRLQVLSDDLLRCKQLKGMSHDQVIALLGQPDEQLVDKGKRVLNWDIGPERDSFFQIDDELLVLTFGQDQKLSSAEMVQS